MGRFRACSFLHAAQEMRRQKVERKGVEQARRRHRAVRVSSRHALASFCRCCCRWSLAGCGRVTDSEQLRLCRLILPVLHPEGTEIREIRVGPASVGRAGRAHRLRGARAGCGQQGALRCLWLWRDHVRARPARPRGGRNRRGRARGSAAPLSQALLAERGGARGRSATGTGGAATPGGRRLCAAAACQCARARCRLRAARDRLFADLRAGRAHQSGLRRDRRARRLWGDRRGRGGGRARHRRCHHRPCARLRAGGGDLGRLERAGRPHGDRAAARAPSARPADPDRNGCRRAFRAGVSPHLARRTRALDAAHVQPADRACARAGFRRDGDADADRGGAVSALRQPAASSSCSAARASAAPGAPSPTIRERPLCSASMAGGSSPRPSCSPACSRASPDGSSPPTTATSRFRWARCSG